MKQTLLLLLLGGSIIAGVFALGVQDANALECSWTQYEYRCTEGYWSSEYQCTWYDDPPQTYCEPSTIYETQCGWEVQCDADDTNCKMVWACKQVAVPSQNCTTTDPPPYKSCEYNSVWVPGSCGNYPTYKSQTCPANSETSCSYATDCSTSGSKNVTSYSCGSSGCQSSTTPATCTRTFSTCANNVGETGVVCGGGCTAPADKTLSVSVTATPSSGPAPLKNVKIDASVGGTATGTITYKLDCTNDLVYDATETSSSTSYTFTKKCDYDTAGTYTVRVNVTRQTLGTSNTASITVTPASQCAAPQNPTCTYNSQTTFLHNAKTLTLSWGSVGSVSNYLMEWARFDKNYGDTIDTTGGISRTVNSTSGDTFNLSEDKTFKLHVRAETSSGSACSTPGPFTADIECYTGTCQKITTPRTDSFTVPVQTSNGTKNCTINATHSGRDLKDSSSVSYQETSSQTDSTTNKSTIAMDDDSSGGCQDNLVFTNSFGMPGTGTLNAIGEANSKRAGHDLSFGYRFTTSECVITGVQANTAWNVENAADNSYLGGPIIEADKKAASLQQAVYADTDTVKKISDFGFTLKECTQDSHCSADPNKAYCNGAATRTTSNFPLNTCIDSAAPTISVTNIKRTSPADQIQDIGIPSSSKWLKAGIYEISISVDPLGGSAIDTTYRPVIIRSKGPDDAWDTADDRVYSTTRTTANKFNVWVGPASSSLNDCVDEKADRCRVEVLARDLAGNERLLLPYPTLNIDYTPPTAQ